MTTTAAAATTTIATMGKMTIETTESATNRIEKNIHDERITEWKNHINKLTYLRIARKCTIKIEVKNKRKSK